jgi:hydroxymethylpyrimidine kinase/phosphomethylpyrimidine kinase/thiamine-phosphate diphosphorylase
MKAVITIAGSDSSGAAGIEADLRAFAFLQIPACVAVTAVTAQGPRSVKNIQLVDPDVIRDQIEMARQSYEIRAAKIGMLGSASQVHAVVTALRGNRPRHIVLDPVIRSTSGVRLLTEDGVDVMVRELFPLANVVTPNIDELHELTKMPVESKEDRIAAAQRILEFGAECVLIKGGHLDGWPINTLVRRERKPYETYTNRVDTQHARGTGCLLSALLAGYLAAGHRIENAIRDAGEAVYLALQSPVVPSNGNGYPNLFGRSNSIFNPDRISGIYFVSNAALNPQVTHTIGARLAMDGGAQIIQLREKHYSPNYLVHFARRMKNIAEKRNGLFIVNDRVDIALAAGADGVHLGPEDMEPEIARRVLGPAKVIGASVSTLKEARLIAEYCDYLAVGAIFGSLTKGDAGNPVGVERITEIKSAFPEKKVVAIGGINLSNIASVAAAGADAAAVVSGIVCAPDPEQATPDLLAE